MDLARSAAILAVLALHLELLGPRDAGVVGPVWRAFAGKGALGVTVFFVVSGFLITRVLRDGPGGLGRPGLRAFYVRRAGRILPPLLAALVLGWWMNLGVTKTTEAFRATFNGTGHFLRPSLYLSVAGFGFNWMRLLGPFPGYGLHWDVLWSLAVEEQFYLLYPLALRALKGRRVAAFLGFWVVAGPLARAAAAVAHPGDFLWVYTNSVGCFDQLALGGLLLLAREKWGATLDKDRVSSAALAVAGAGLAAGAWAGVATAVDLVWGPSLVALGTALFLLGGLSLTSLNGRTAEAFGLPGRLSYEAYLLQGAVLYVLWGALRPLGAGTGFLLWAASATAAAWAFSRFFAVPANAWVRARLAR